MGKPEPILREIFRINDQPYSFFLFQHQLAWCPQKKGGEDMSEWINVKLKYVLIAETLLRTGPSKTNSNCCLLTLKKNKSASYPLHVLEVTFAQAKRDSEKWRDITLELIHNDVITLTKWAQAIQFFLSEFKQRPKNLLFFVNPFGGRRNANMIHEKHIKPILQLCKVKSTVIETKRQNHVSDTLTAMSDEELMSYDAVVAVGGDGTICEVVNGLLTRKLRKSNSIITETDLKPAPLPVAVVAAGSTNATAFTLQGNDDPRTAIIHIVLGGSVPLDVVSVQNDSGIMRFIVGQMSYGYLADTLLHSENFRWMGPKRYDYAGFRELINHGTYEGSIDIKQTREETRKAPTQCAGGKGLGCPDCNDNVESPSDYQWKRIEGKFIGVSAANISLQCPRSRLGLAPFAHLSDGCMELILIRQASRVDHLRYLLRTSRDSRTAFALPFVERYRVKEFVFTPMQCNNNYPEQFIPLEDMPMNLQTCKCDLNQEKPHSLWNCDGELLFQPSVRVSVHSNLIQILGRGDKEHSSYTSTLSDDWNDPSQCATVSSTVSLPFTRSPSLATEELNTSMITLKESNFSLNDIRY